MSKIHYRTQDNVALLTLDDGKVNVMNWEFSEN